MIKTIKMYNKYICSMTCMIVSPWLDLDLLVFKKEKLVNIPAAIFESGNMTLKDLDKGLAVLNDKLLSVIISQVMASAFTICISRLVFVWFSTQ